MRGQRSCQEGLCRWEIREAGQESGKRSAKVCRSSFVELRHRRRRVRRAHPLRQECQKGGERDAYGNRGADQDGGEAIHLCYLKYVVGVT